MTWSSAVNEIVKIARSWLKTPYRHQGRIKGRAVDCVGLIIGIAHELGISDYDNRSYTMSPNPLTMRLLLDAHLDNIPKTEKRPGDILLLRLNDDPTHLAIFCGKTIIHAYSSVAKCCEHELDKYWESRIKSVYRFRGR